MAESLVDVSEKVIPGDVEVATKQPRRFVLFENHNLRLLWFGESISLLGDQFYMVAMPWLVLQLTGSAIAVGTIVAVAGIPRALLMLIGGVFTDSVTPRVLMLFSNASRIVITGLLTFLVLTNTIQVWMLYVFSLAFGIVDAFFQPAAMAIVPALVTEEQLASANAAMQGTALMVTAAGPGIAGALVKIVGTSFAFFLDTISFAVATVMLLVMMPPKAEAKPAKHGSIMADIREAMAYIRQDELLGLLLIIVVALNFLFTGPLMVGPAVLAKERFAEQGSVAMGILLSAMGLGSLIGMVGGSVLKPTRMGLLTLSTIMFAGVGIAAAAFTSSLGIMAVLFAVVGASTGFSNLLLITWLQKRISKEMMGRVMSIIMLASMGLMPISAAVAGFVANTSLTLLFALNGSLLVLTAILSLLNKKVRAMRA